MLVFNLFILLFLVPYGYSTPLEPGQEGGPWTEEEIDIVREKAHPFHFKSVFFLNKKTVILSPTRL